MRQILCDLCHMTIDPEQIIGDEAIVYAAVATGSKEDAYWREYHRKCARKMRVADVWAQHGLVPL